MKDPERKWFLGSALGVGPIPRPVGRGETAWSGIITVRNLIVLRNFGRIEGLS